MLDSSCRVNIRNCRRWGFSDSPMWSGWFGGYSAPSDYGNAEMPDWINITATSLCLLFILPFVAYLMVLPGVREKRIVTTLIFAFILLEGGSLAASLYYPSWTVGSQGIVSAFRAHKRERVYSNLGINVGLQHLNVSMTIVDVITRDYNDMSELVGTKHNEKFDISSVSSMHESLMDAYEHGLPYPMLAVLEYFSLNQDAFDWGRHYRQAGHYAHAAIWLSLSLWMISVLFLLFLPHCFYIATLCSGMASLLSVVIYLIMSPPRLSISFVGLDGQRIELEMCFGWCFYLILSIGVISIVVGLTLLILQQFSVYTLSTFMESYLDETVSLKKKTAEEIPHISFSSLEYMHQQKKPAPSEKNSASSSGFESRNSLRSSFDSIHELNTDTMEKGAVPVHLKVHGLSPGANC
ncbi:hypothetical protein PFISCL1PPCAC_10394 [Pristionchus fissidentatus]|uniref:DUOXA-like protein C06E1.3 n=1 Tax=Pristionchus fissidentatus TaxID=1538716 RepID=A0AAV5VK84_9BILA|nr:hypothetical protein PFISCL1PPCAC_10394 [Pristionchus fissidentatus]